MLGDSFQNRGNLAGCCSRAVRRASLASSFLLFLFIIQLPRLLTLPYVSIPSFLGKNIFSFRTCSCVLYTPAFVTLYHGTLIALLLFCRSYTGLFCYLYSLQCTAVYYSTERVRVYLYCTVRIFVHVSFCIRGSFSRSCSYCSFHTL